MQTDAAAFREYLTGLEFYALTGLLERARKYIILFRGKVPDREATYVVTGNGIELATVPFTAMTEEEQRARSEFTPASIDELLDTATRYEIDIPRLLARVKREHDELECEFAAAK